MKIAPIDLAQKTFTQAFRGYEPQEVNAFLERVREDWEELLKRVRSLETDLAHREREVEALRGQESDLKETLILARKVSADVKANAEREAEAIVAGARLEAGKVEAEWRRRRDALQEEVERLGAIRARHLAAVRSALEVHRTLLEVMEMEDEEASEGSVSGDGGDVPGGEPLGAALSTASRPARTGRRGRP
ncbi:DivIVA domain-containing protein [Myxococcota bacterium]|nr:DivIVA domain-containing protein [Myxococcota bacterium]